MLKILCSLAPNLYYFSKLLTFSPIYLSFNPLAQQSKAVRRLILLHINL